MPNLDLARRGTQFNSTRYTQFKTGARGEIYSKMGRWCEVKRFALDSARTRIDELRHVFLSFPRLTTLHHGSCQRVWLRINLEPWRNFFMQWIGWIWRRAVPAVFFGPVCTTPRNVKGWWWVAWMILESHHIMVRRKVSMGKIEAWIWGHPHPWDVIRSVIHSNKQQAKKVWSPSTAFRREVKPSNS